MTMHDYRSQRADTFETFRQAAGGAKLPATAVVVFLFVAENTDTDWKGVEKALRAQGFKTRNNGDELEARIGPIAIDPDTVWDWERRATEIVLPFNFWPDGWELDD
jgi:hypothetical protein